MTQSACDFPRCVAQLFPDDHLLEQKGFESYAGLPLFGEGGRPLGLVVLLDQKEMSTTLATRYERGPRPQRNDSGHPIDVNVHVLVSSGNRDAEVDAPLLVKPDSFVGFERMVAKTAKPKEAAGNRREDLG